METLSRRLRALCETHGRRTLVLLALILAVGFGLRAYRVVEPLATPGDDAHAYYGLAKALYVEGSYGGPEFEDPSDWSPGAPLLYDASAIELAFEFIVIVVPVVPLRCRAEWFATKTTPMRWPAGNV